MNLINIHCKCKYFLQCQSILSETFHSNYNFIVSTDSTPLLQSKFVNCPLYCELCGEQSESDWHLFFQCSNSLLCWTTAGLWHVLRDCVQWFSSTAAVLSDVFSRKAEDVAEL